MFFSVVRKAKHILGVVSTPPDWVFGGVVLRTVSTSVRLMVENWEGSMETDFIAWSANRKPVTLGSAFVCQPVRSTRCFLRQSGADWSAFLLR